MRKTQDFLFLTQHKLFQRVQSTVYSSTIINFINNGETIFLVSFFAHC